MGLLDCKVGAVGFAQPGPADEALGSAQHDPPYAGTTLVCPSAIM